MDKQLVSLFKQLPGYWGCKDLNSVFLYANDAYASLVGLASSRECSGRTDFDMPSATTRFAHCFQEQDRYVIQTQKSLKVLDIHPYPDGCWHAHIFTKTPWFDENGTVQGTIFYGQDLTDTAVLEVGHWVCRATGMIAPPNLHHLPSRHEDGLCNLTIRESEILFLLLYGKKPKFIANAMNISIKTFESYVVRLRHKFGAHSKAHLIDLALDKGFGSRIPQTLLKTQLSVVLNCDYAA